MPASLYQRLLREDFARLPPVLRKFHGSESGGLAIGIATITRKRDRTSTALARLFGLPPAGADVPVQLVVIPERNGERWVRSFGGHEVTSFQWIQGMHLAETAGPLTVRLRLYLSDDGLIFESEEAYFFCRRFKANFLIAVTAEVRPGKSDWQVTVGFRNRLVGEFCRYEAIMRPHAPL